MGGGGVSGGARWGVRSLVQEVKAHCAAAAAHQEVSDGQTPFLLIPIFSPLGQNFKYREESSNSPGFPPNTYPGSVLNVLG